MWYQRRADEKLVLSMIYGAWKKMIREFRYQTFIFGIITQDVVYWLNSNYTQNKQTPKISPNKENKSKTINQELNYCKNQINSN